MNRILFLSGCLILLISCDSMKVKPEELSLKSIDIFKNNMIHFSPGDSLDYETVTVSSADNGREIQTQVFIPVFDGPVKITAHVKLRPIPKDLLSVWDPWDRAGHVRLVLEDAADIEIMKFMTAYGGETNWELDVSYLAPVLKGACTFAGFIDTWVSPGWRMDFSLTFEPSRNANPDWLMPVFYQLEYKADNPGENGLLANLIIPDGLNNISLHYLVSGHCTDGRGADEFEPKDNVFYVDDLEVKRLQPWRDDCRQFRAINPYTRRWSSGDWSSDFSRSGWCPGDVVPPLKIDAGTFLGPGDHEMKLVIEGVRPEDADGHLGYWRVSAYLVGWKN